MEGTYMQIGKIIRPCILYIVRQIERNEFGKFALRVFYNLSKILSIWIETINDVDTLKVKKKEVNCLDNIFLNFIFFICSDQLN
jgi:hypothetical protein